MLIEGTERTPGFMAFCVYIENVCLLLSVPSQYYVILHQPMQCGETFHKAFPLGMTEDENGI